MKFLLLFLLLLVFSIMNVYHLLLLQYINAAIKLFLETPDNAPLFMGPNPNKGPSPVPSPDSQTNVRF